MKNIKNALVRIIAITALWPVCSSTNNAEVVGEIFEIDNGALEGFSPVWGMIRAEDHPWIKSVRLDWIYLHQDSSGGAYWIWVERLGWIYSEVGLFPQAFRYSSNAWIVLDLTFQPALKFLNLRTRVWETIRNPGEGDLQIYGEVPKDIRGLTYSEVGHNFSNSIEVGPYYYAQSHTSRVSSVKNYYYYNESDGWFYPLWEEGGASDYGIGFLSALFEWRRVKVERSGQEFLVTWNDRLWDSPDEIFSYPTTSSE
jgi:hypothetical protein